MLDLRLNPNNPRQITKKDFEALKKSIQEFPEMLEKRPIVYDENNIILGGNMRYRALKKLESEGFEVKDSYFVNASGWTEAQKREFVIKDNVERGDWDTDILANEWSDLPLDEWGIDTGEWGDNVGAGVADSHLKENFLFPPFSLLRAYSGEWLERKSFWKNKINDKAQARKNAKSYGQTIRSGSGEIMSFDGDGVSILDPVLSELIVKWFGIAGGSCFDCFAGDTVFGYVSSYMGMNFTGIDLRQEQVEFNNKSVRGKQAVYICDDGQNVLNHIEKSSQDLFFSCPPYFNLEKYSDLENDASNQNFENYIKIIDTALINSCKALKEDRFAVIVISNVRERGVYLDLVGSIVSIMLKAGLKYYNDMVLATPLGTAPFRARSAMRNRKIVKVHQNVLVFYKGNPKNIQHNFPLLNESYEDYENGN